MKTVKKENTDELRPEYDFDYSRAIRGKYCRKLLKEGSNIIVLEPDIARSFQDSTAVNEALRSLLEFTNSTICLTKRSRGKPKTRKS
jgi:hypothetical protein